MNLNFFTGITLKNLLTKQIKNEALTAEEKQALDTQATEDPESVISARAEVLEDENKNLSTENQRLQADNDNLKAENERLANELNDSKNRETEASQNTQQITDLEARLEQANAENERLTNELTSANTTIDSLRAELESLTDANKKLAAETGKAIIPKGEDGVKSKAKNANERAIETHYKSMNEWNNNPLLK